MAANKFILTSNGFYKGTELEYGNITDSDRRIHRHILGKRIEYTHNLRDALPLTLKQARNIIQKDKIDGFVWSPFEQDNSDSDKKYKVVRKDSEYDFINSSHHPALEWVVVKVWSEKTTDYGYLSSLSNTTPKVELYDFETATQIAREKNEIILAEITKILNR